MPRPDGRVDLMNAAERLFAENGIPPVSDRKIAETAGNSNHSAVKYYFGGRTGLLEALLNRHLDALEPARKAMFAESDTLLGDIRALVIPAPQTFAQLPQPNWRARFLRQAYSDPATVELLRDDVDRAPAAGAVLASIAERLSHIDPVVIAARARLMTYIIITACADIEENAGDGTTSPWTEAGDFLCDAIAGMLQAPVTSSSSVH